MKLKRTLLYLSLVIFVGMLGVSWLTLGTGTLGGSLAAKPSGISDLVHHLGGEIYTTFYVPDITLWLLVAASVILLVQGVWGSRRHA